MVRGKLIAAAIVVAVSAGSGGAYWFYSRAPEAVLACDEEIKEMLKAPSSYRQVRYQIMDQKLTKEQFARERPPPEGLSQSLEEYWLDAATDPVKRSILIDYDAHNAFGTAIRGQHVCDYALPVAAKEIDRNDISNRRHKVLMSSLDKMLGR